MLDVGVILCDCCKYDMVQAMLMVCQISKLRVNSSTSLTRHSTYTLHAYSMYAAQANGLLSNANNPEDDPGDFMPCIKQHCNLQEGS